MNVWDNGVTIELETKEEREMMRAILAAVDPEALERILFAEQKDVPYRRRALDLLKLVQLQLE